MLIEIHVLQNHAPSNLNRDDTGSPKECVFGGYKRGRISSQCLKRTVRRSNIFQQVLAGHLATRTRRLPEIVAERLVAAGLDAEMSAIAAKKASGFGTKEGKERDTPDTAQTMFLTESDIAAVTQALKEAAAEAGTPPKFDKMPAKDLQAKALLKGYRPITPDVALFGRMTTSEAFRDVEASCQVAHALSTHKVDHEFDYFTAVDDLQGLSEEEEDAGADMIGDVEFNSACYYKYFSVDAAGLTDNLTGAGPYRRKDVSAEDRAAARELAAKAVEAMLKAVVLVTPTGKQNSFAAHQLPAAVLVEVRPYPTPVSYANAFVEPARAGKGDDLVWASLQKLAGHVAALTDGFNLESTARLLLAPVLAPEHGDFSIAGTERVPDLNTLAARVGAVIREAHDTEAVGHG
jgi:CRISPR system Cascade subunit CasC